MAISGLAFVRVITQGGTAFATAMAPVTTGVGTPPWSGAAPGTESGVASHSAPLHVTPFVFSSHPAEGPGAFCLARAEGLRPEDTAFPHSRVDVPLLAYVSAERANGVRPTAPWVPVVVEDLTNGSTLATFYSTEVKAMAFSADCERLYVVGEDGVERSWHVMHRHGGEKPGWAKHLSSLVFGSELWRDPDGREATRAVPGALGGQRRADLLAEIRAAKDKGDPSAAYVWQHWFGPDTR